MRIVLALIVSVFIASTSIARQNPASPETSTENPKQAVTKKKETRKEQPSPAPAVTESKPPETAAKHAEPSKPESPTRIKRKKNTTTSPKFRR